MAPSATKAQLDRRVGDVGVSPRDAGRDAASGLAGGDTSAAGTGAIAARASSTTAREFRARVDRVRRASTYEANGGVAAAAFAGGRGGGK